MSAQENSVPAAAPYEGEYRLIDTSGHVRWVWDTAVTVFDAGGTPQAVHGVISRLKKCVRLCARGSSHQ